MSINISELIWTVICFFVLLVVLKKLLFDPLVSFMAARDARIQDGISAGRTAQQQLDAAAQARSDAQRIRRPHRPRATCAHVCAAKRPPLPPPWTRSCPSSSRR